VIVNITGGSDLSLAEAAEATSLITKVADPEANVIYGIVTDESMGGAVKVTVIATGFKQAGARKVAPTPVDLTNYVGPGAVPAGAAAESGGFYRKTPQAKTGTAGGRQDLDVPTFLRRQGQGGGPGE
jgi:cell division protein FtsZ